MPPDAKRAQPPTLDASRAAESDAGRQGDAGIVPLLVDDVTAAAMLGIHRATVHKLVTSGLMPAPIKLGRASRWSVELLSAWTSAGCPTADEFAARRRSERARA